MDERGTKLWIQKVWKPYVVNYDHSVLFLDYFACHKSVAVIEIFKNNVTEDNLTAGGYICVVPPCHHVT